jgi:hypothetical protein
MQIYSNTPRRTTDLLIKKKSIQGGWFAFILIEGDPRAELLSGRLLRKQKEACHGARERLRQLQWLFDMHIVPGASDAL